MRFSLRTTLLSLAVSAVSAGVEARDLAEILRQGARNNPEIMEAQANEAVSKATLEQTKAGLYPKVQATANQPLLSTQSSHAFTPGLAAQWTLYDFGKTRASIKADEISTQYYRHKIDETAQTWANQLAGYYLEALLAKLQLQAARENLALHNHIVDQMRIINQYDPGRRSELTQAESRQINVQQNLVAYERNLGLNLRKIARYVHPAVSAEELQDPFSDLSVNEIIQRYPADPEHLSNNASLLAQEQELKKNEANLVVAEKSRWPSVGVQAQANKDEAAVYLTMSVDVFDAGKSPAIDEQRYKIQAAKAKIAQMRDDLSQQAELAIIDMQKYENQINILDRQIVALQQVVVDYEDQFKIGTRTLLNVVDAYGELANAKQSKAGAEYQLMKAKLDYLTAVGALSQWAQLPPLTQEPAPQRPPIPQAATPPDQLVIPVPPAEIKLTSLDDDALDSSHGNTFISVDASGDLIIVNKPAK